MFVVHVRLVSLQLPALKLFTIGRSSTDFNFSSSIALILSSAVAILGIVAFAVPWSTFRHSVDGSSAWLEGEVFVSKVCYECYNSSDDVSCASSSRTCVSGGVGGATGTITCLALGLFFACATVAADLGRICVSFLRPHRDEIIAAFVSLSALSFMVSFSIYSASTGSTTLPASVITTALVTTQSIELSLSMTPSVGFILVIFAWLVGFLAILPLFCLISRTHDFYNFVSHISNATRSASMHVNNNNTLSCSINTPRSGQFSVDTPGGLPSEASGHHRIATLSTGSHSSVLPGPPSGATHKMSTTDMDLSRYLPRGMSMPSAVGSVDGGLSSSQIRSHRLSSPISAPGHHHTMSMPPNNLTVPAIRSQHIQSKSVDMPPAFQNSPQQSQSQPGTIVAASPSAESPKRLGLPIFRSNEPAAEGENPPDSIASAAIVIGMGEKGEGAQSSMKAQCKIRAFENPENGSSCGESTEGAPKTTMLLTPVQTSKPVAR